MQLGVRYAMSVGYGGCCSRHVKRQFVAGRDYRLEQEGGVVEEAPSAIINAAPLHVSPWKTAERIIGL